MTQGGHHFRKAPNYISTWPNRLYNVLLALAVKPFYTYIVHCEPNVVWRTHDIALKRNCHFFIKFSSLWQLPLQPATKISSKWHFRFWLANIYIIINYAALTHWGRVTHICVGNLTVIGPDNGLSPDRRQAIIWTNAGILLIEPLGTNFSDILIEILAFSFKKMRLKVSSAKWRPFCLGLNVMPLWTSSVRLTLKTPIKIISW